MPAAMPTADMTCRSSQCGKVKLLVLGTLVSRRWSTSALGISRGELGRGAEVREGLGSRAVAAVRRIGRVPLIPHDRADARGAWRQHRGRHMEQSISGGECLRSRSRGHHRADLPGRRRAGHGDRVPVAVGPRVAAHNVRSALSRGPRIGRSAQCPRLQPGCICVAAWLAWSMMRTACPDASRSPRRITGRSLAASGPRTSTTSAIPAPEHAAAQQGSPQRCKRYGSAFLLGDRPEADRSLARQPVRVLP